jgi:hypothetical protein
MFQALAKRIRKEKGEESRIELMRGPEHTPDQSRTLRIEKEKQIGVCKYY